MKYKAIFFDADGVLIRNKYLFTDQLKQDYGIEIQKMLPFFTGVFRECAIGKADLKEELGKVIDEWGWKGSVDELLRYWLSKGTEIEEEVLKYIKAVKAQGVRCYLATDQEKYRGEYLQRTFGNGNPFEQVFFSAAIGTSKKTEPFWEAVFAKVNEPREQTLFVDDDEDNIKAVSSFGIDTLLFRNLNDLKKKLVEQYYVR